MLAELGSNLLEFGALGVRSGRPEFLVKPEVAIRQLHKANPNQVCACMRMCVGICECVRLHVCMPAVCRCMHACVRTCACMCVPTHRPTTCLAAV